VGDVGGCYLVRGADGAVDSSEGGSNRAVLRVLLGRV